MEETITRELRALSDRLGRLEAKLDGVQEMLEELLNGEEARSAEAEAERTGYVPLEQVKADLNL